MKDKKEERKVGHVVSLVLGIISIVSMLFWYISLPSGIIAIIFGVKKTKNV